MRGSVAVFRFNMILIALVSMSVMFALPAPRHWLTDRILEARFNPFDQMRHIGLQDRLESKYGKSYRVYQRIAGRLASNHNALVLLPPAGYVETLNNPNMSSLAEPSVFYYFTGVRGIYPDNPSARKANWILVVGEKEVGLRAIERASQMEAIMKSYNEYLHQ